MSEPHRNPILNVARVVIEAATPLSISTGNPDGVFDTALVRDANGLPALPGTSLAGVLRHLWQAQYDVESTERLFGHATGKDGQPSRLAVSWGALLDSQGQPAEGLLIGQQKERLNDPVYARLLDQIDAPQFRNRVRLGHKGAAMGTGKFDRTVLAAGHRFAVELRLQCAADDDGQEWRNLLALLAHPGFRLGGATRAGLGSLRLVSVHQARFDLRQAADVARLADLGHGLAETAGLEPFTPQAEAQGWVTGTLRLHARGLWRIGQGGEPLSNKEKPADLLPVTEERLVWTSGSAQYHFKLVLLPASSLKGALAHRMAFHAHCLEGRWADELSSDEEPDKPDAVADLLGIVKESRHDDKGQAGRLYLDDGYLTLDPKIVQHLMHNAIDRFTGGVRNRVLFEEESLLGGSLEIPVAIDLARLPDATRGHARLAFKRALDDLCAGRLGLGSRTTSGNGFFSGEVTGSLKAWLDETPDSTQEAA